MQVAQFVEFLGKGIERFRVGQAAIRAALNNVLNERECASARASLRMGWPRAFLRCSLGSRECPWPWARRSKPSFSESWPAMTKIVIAASMSFRGMSLATARSTIMVRSSSAPLPPTALESAV